MVFLYTPAPLWSSPSSIGLVFFCSITCSQLLCVLRFLPLYYLLFINNSVTKNPHCAGARTVPALYGCGPHSNLISKGHWTLILRKKFEKKKIFFPVFLLFYSQFRKYCTLNHIFFKTLLLCINFGYRCEYGCA